MRLSFGFIRDGRLACLYHGWQFDGAARCRHIPAHPDLNVPGTIHARPYAVTERAGLAWVALDGHPSPDDLPSGERIGARSIAIFRPIERVAEALGLGDAQWGERDGALIALHEPETGVTLLHVAVADPARRDAAAGWVRTIRDRLEEAL